MQIKTLKMKKTDKAVACLVRVKKVGGDLIQVFAWTLTISAYKRVFHFIGTFASEL